MDNPDRQGPDAAATDGQTELDRFAHRSAMRVETVNVSGVFVSMANVGVAPALYSASSAAFARSDAVSACLGEAAEIWSWLWRDQDRDRLEGDPRAIADTSIDAGSILGFGDGQIAGRERLNRAWAGWDRIPTPCVLTNPAHWVRAASMNGAFTSACPAFLAFGRYGTACGDTSLDTDTNGCAAGPTLEVARRKALFELVERDATGLWWHCGLICPRYRPADVPDQELRLAAHQHLVETGRRLWFLDISNMQSVTTLVAVSCEPDGSRLMFGFGCAPNSCAAARGAFCEMVQGEVALDAFEIRRLEGRPAPQDCRLTRWLRHADVGQHRFVIGEGAAWPHAGLRGPADVEREFVTSLGTPWFVDLSRSDVGIPVVKAFAAGLATISRVSAWRGCSDWRKTHVRHVAPSDGRRRENF